MLEYHLETDVAKFAIRSEPLGLWDLWVDEMPTLTFATLEDAARAVFLQNTGYVVWDQLTQHSAPAELVGWAEHKDV